MLQNINTVLSEFKIYLENCEYGKSTISGYLFGLADFLNYLRKNNIDFDNFDNRTLELFKESLFGRNSDSTINTKIFSIIKYADYLKSLGIQINDLKPNLNKLPKKKNINLIKDFKKIINHVYKINKNNITKGRDKLLLELLYYTGIRPRDLLELKAKDFIDNTLLTSRERIVIDKYLCDQITEHILKNNLANDNFLFFNYAQRHLNLNRHLTEKSVEEIFNKYKIVLDNNLSLRDLRHSYRIGLQNNFDNIKINKIYSHKVISFSGHYLQINKG